ncbi:MAG: metal-dependent hydrolase [Planctomycetota bacterium]|jgi:inner membrane protein
MDSFTQGLLGAAVAEAAVGHKLGRKAAVFGAICGVLPDLDMFARFAGRWASIQHHRAESHSLILLPFASLLIGYLGHRFFGKKKTAYKYWLIAAAGALITHPLLDLCTSYGTQLLAPLSRIRFTIDSVGVIDLFYSLPLYAALLFTLAFKKLRKPARIISIIVLVLTTGYLATGYTQRNKAIEIASSQLAGKGVNIKRIRSTPSLLTIFLWRIIAEDNNGVYHTGTLSTAKPHTIDFYTFKSNINDLPDEVTESKKYELFKWFSNNYCTINENILPDNTREYILTDMRYSFVSSPDHPIFSAKAVITSDNKFVDFEMVRNKRRNIKTEIKSIWRKTLYPLKNSP